MKTGNHLQGAKVRRRKSKKGNTAKPDRRRAVFIGTRPLKLPLTLRGQAVEVEVLPAVGTTTHVNYEITIRHDGKVLDWVPTRAELEHIGRAAGMLTEPQTSH